MREQTTVILDQIPEAVSRLSDKKITVLILDDINQSIQRYMFMLLSIPLTVIVKVVTQHVEQLQPVAELLGD